MWAVLRVSTRINLEMILVPTVHQGSIPICRRRTRHLRASIALPTQFLRQAAMLWGRVCAMQDIRGLLGGSVPGARRASTRTRSGLTVVCSVAVIRIRRLSGLRTSRHASHVLRILSRARAAYRRITALAMRGTRGRTVALARRARQERPREPRGPWRAMIARQTNSARRRRQSARIVRRNPSLRRLAPSSRLAFARRGTLGRRGARVRIAYPGSTRTLPTALSAAAALRGPIRATTKRQCARLARTIPYRETRVQQRRTASVMRDIQGPTAGIARHAWRAQ